MERSTQASLALLAAVLLMNVNIVISRPPPSSSYSYEDCDANGNCYNVTRNQYDYYYYSDYSDSGSSNAQPSSVSNTYSSNTNSNEYITNESNISNNYNYAYNGQADTTYAQSSQQAANNPSQQATDQSQNSKGKHTFNPPNAGGVIGDLVSIPNVILGQAVEQVSGIGNDWFDIAKTPLKLANDIGILGGSGSASVSSNNQISQQDDQSQNGQFGVRGEAKYNSRQHSGILSDMINIPNRIAGQVFLVK